LAFGMGRIQKGWWGSSWHSLTRDWLRLHCFANCFTGATNLNINTQAASAHAVCNNKIKCHSMPLQHCGVFFRALKASQNLMSSLGEVVNSYRIISSRKSACHFFEWLSMCNEWIRLIKCARSDERCFLRNFKNK